MEADQIRLKRLGQEKNSKQKFAGEGEGETKEDFERIFHDSGIEFAHLNGSVNNLSELIEKSLLRKDEADGEVSQSEI